MWFKILLLKNINTYLVTYCLVIINPAKVQKQREQAIFIKSKCIQNE